MHSVHLTVCQYNSEEEEVLSLVTANGRQVSLLVVFHPNSSLETTEGLLASRQAGAY